MHFGGVTLELANIVEGQLAAETQLNWLLVPSF